MIVSVPTVEPNSIEVAAPNAVMVLVTLLNNERFAPAELIISPSKYKSPPMLRFLATDIPPAVTIEPVLIVPVNASVLFSIKTLG